MEYNPNIHHRKSIRLKGYDYSQAGMYFITICTQKRACLFGNITNGEMELNDAGEMIRHWYYELQNKFNDIKCHNMVIMPNHVHYIIENTVGADLCVCPNAPNAPNAPNVPNARPNNTNDNTNGRDILGEHEMLGEHILGEHIGSPLRDVIRWFKTMTTNHYIRGVKQNDWMPFNNKLWQRNYYEHIIRNDLSYQNISDYITNNPIKWDADKLNQTKNNK